jgi:hypothetical protein
MLCDNLVAASNEPWHAGCTSNNVMRSRALVLSTLLASARLAEPSLAGAATNFDVGATGMTAYHIGAADNPDLTLTRGETYTFNVKITAHPFWITTARGAGDAEANAFSPGVTNNGASVPGIVTFKVPAAASATLFYQCGFHDTMGGTLHIVAAVAPAAPWSGSVGYGALAGLLLSAGVALRRGRRSSTGSFAD